MSGFGPGAQLAGLVIAIGRVIRRDQSGDRRAIAPATAPPDRRDVRAGELHIHLAPSAPGLVEILFVRNRYCGQVSAKTFSAAARAPRGSTLAPSRGRDVEDHRPAGRAIR